jgi:hypothetical protein
LLLITREHSFAGGSFIWFIYILSFTFTLNPGIYFAAVEVPSPHLRTPKQMHCLDFFHPRSRLVKTWSKRGLDTHCPSCEGPCSRRLLKYTSIRAQIIRDLRRLAGVCLLGLGERGAELLDGELGEPLAHVDGLLQRLALDDTGDEATGEGITVTMLDRQWLWDCENGTYPAPLVS